MDKNNDFIYEAIASLEKTTGTSIATTIGSNGNLHNISLQIKDEIFYCITKENAKNSNYGIIMSTLAAFPHTGNSLIIADYLPRDTARKLKENDINYLDASGNAYITSEKFFVYVEGRKAKIFTKTNQTRAFQEAGLKLLLLLISNPETLQLPYRNLAEKTGIALGSVSNIFKELKENNYLFKTKNKRVLKNQNDLIERWVIAYNELLKPRSFRKKMRPIGNEFRMKSVLDEIDIKFYFGGEPGGQLLTGYLKPKDYIIFTDEEIGKVEKELKLVPDESGNIEIYRKFWTDNLHLKNEDTAPPLVVYADLLGTGNDRNIETAKIIRENGL